MSMNTHFVIGIHCLTLTTMQGRAVSSNEIAVSVRSNPVFIRRVLTMLRSAGLVKISLGVHGGVYLARPPSEITLLDIYRAVVEDKLLPLHHTSPNPDCPCGGSIQPVLHNIFDEAERALEVSLQRYTIQDLVSRIQQRNAFLSTKQP